MFYFLGKFIKGLAKNFSQLVAPLAAFFIAWQGDLQSKIVLVVAALAIFSVASSFLRYLAFRYRVDHDAIRIRDGILQKKELKIRFDRVQGINAEQNFAFRLLGLITLSFDTAGSGKSEGVLPAIRHAEAESLRDRVGSTVPDASASEEAPEPVQQQELLLTLGWRDMIRIGLADGRALVLLAFLGPVMERAGDRLEAIIAATVEDAAQSLERFSATAGAAILVAVVLTIILLFALASILAAFLRYHDYHLYLQGARLRSTGGLVTRHENAMRLAKVQILSVRQGIVLRLFRRFRIVAKQATSSSRDKSARHFIVPLVRRKFAERFSGIVFEPEAAGIGADPWHSDFSRVSGHYLRARIFVVALLPAAAIACLFLLLGAGPAAAWSMLWVPAGILLVYQSWRRLAYRHDDDGIVRRSGLLGVRTEAFLFRKVQRVSIRQSWFQRRRRLANLKLYTAAGAVSIPYIGAGTAARLRDYVLFRVESSDRAWH